MRKNMILFVICIGICYFAWRFGGLEKADVKQVMWEHLSEGIVRGILPVIGIYDMPDGYLLYEDIHNAFLPSLPEEEQESSLTTAAPMTETGEEQGIGEEGTAEGENTAGGEDTEEGKISGGEDTEEGKTSGGEDTEEGTAAEGENGDRPVVSEGMFAMEKQVIINRTKLLEFDYLRQLFYQVDNTTTISQELLDGDSLLKMDMKLNEDVQGPQILIYHTHSLEGYKDSVAGDVSTTVVGVGEYLGQLLWENYGIEVLHHTGAYDIEDHGDSYSNALPAIEQLLKEYPTIEVVIDLHRDGVDENIHLVTQINGKPTAKIMFFNGLSYTTAQGELTYLPNPYLKENLALSLQMQLAAAEYYPGFTRKIYLKGYRYNMHLCPKSMLIEVGAQTNTLEEAKNAMEPLAQLIAYVLKYE